MCPICHCSIRQEVSHQAVAILQHITSKPPEMGAFSIYRLCDALLNRQGWYIGQDKGWISAFAESTSRLTQKGSEGNDLSLIHISEPTRLGMISYAVFCL